ncbi:MAG TPA: Gfo/Idh/MocA family oxidoreductase [Deltaproteobacteria bacterium]|nr:Gfo/Idh/MocA family oxidoreductase [Deltaproteobacteria bacterium]
MERLKVAVIGVGYLGRFHAQKYAAMEDVELVGVVDVDPERAALVAQEVGTRAYGALSEIPVPVQAVSVAVPTSLHAEVAVPLLEKGIAVLLEKPIAADMPAAEAILAAANAGAARLQIGHLERFNPAILKLRERITKPMFIEVHRISPFKERGTDVDVILDLMIHDIDIILSLVNSEIVSIESVGVPVMTTQIDIANARLRFASGCIANITASRISADVMRKIRIFQPDAYISIDYAQHAVDVFTLSADRQILHARDEISEADALQAEIRSFVDALKHGSAILVDGEAGRKAFEVAEMIKNTMILPEGA